MYTLNFLLMTEEKKKTINRAKLGKANKRLGSTIERLYVNIFKQELGYEFCATSRLKSRALDNAKIDIADIPYNIQVKAGKQKGMNPGKELMLMKTAMQEIFPEDNPVHENPCLLIHHKVISSSERSEKGLPKERQENESLVYMTLEQFNKFKKAYPHLKYKSSKDFKAVNDKSEYKTIVCMTFEYFKFNILKNDLQIYKRGSTKLLSKSSS